VPVYFDTNIVRYLSEGLREKSLPPEQQRQVVLSPVSVIELVSQIATVPYEALGAIHALSTWIDIKQIQLLGWPDVIMARWVFSKEIADEVSENLERVLRTCYESKVPDGKLRDDAGALFEFLEMAKRHKATLLENVVGAIRQNPKDNSRENLRAATRLALASGLRERAAAPDEKSEDHIAGCLPAYFEYHTNLIERAVPLIAFNFFTREHLNDHFDAEQLIFLADPSMHFFTADGGYRPAARVEHRVHVLEAGEMQNPAIAPNALTAAIQGVGIPQA
jgi:hypothetical protein